MHTVGILGSDRDHERTGGRDTNKHEHCSLGAKVHREHRHACAARQPLVAQFAQLSQLPLIPQLQQFLKWDHE
jgi:hypothetical protein